MHFKIHYPSTGLLLTNEKLAFKMLEAVKKGL